MIELWAQLKGQFGGLIAAAFAAGAAGGYGFSARTILKIANERIGELKATVENEREECHASIDELKAELKELRDILMGKQPLPRWTGAAVPRDTPADMVGMIDKLDRKDTR